MNLKDFGNKRNEDEKDNQLGKKRNKENSLEEYSSDNDNSKFNDENGDYKTGRWEKIEHSKFLKGCLLFGNNWKKVQNLFNN